MSSEGPLSESARGYLSDESKRRFTLIAGILGAVFFVAQFLLPVLVMVVVMMTMMMGSRFSIADIEQSALWSNELWFIERTTRVNWRDPNNSTNASTLKHVNLDLSDAGPALPLDTAG